MRKGFDSLMVGRPSATITVREVIACRTIEPEDVDLVAILAPEMVLKQLLSDCFGIRDPFRIVARVLTVKVRRHEENIQFLFRWPMNFEFCVGAATLQVD